MYGRSRLILQRPEFADKDTMDNRLLLASVMERADHPLYRSDEWVTRMFDVYRDTDADPWGAGGAWYFLKGAVMAIMEG